MWITGYGERVRRELVWPGEHEPRVAHARYVARLGGAGEELVLAELEGAPGQDVRRFESRVSFPGAGHYEVRAVLEVLRPPAAAGAQPEPTRIESGVLHVRVSGAADPAALGYPRDAARNLLRGALKVEESSHYGDQAAAAAIDGLHGTRWHCDITDDQPWWRATLAKPVEADRLLLSHAWPRALDAGLPQPAVVEVLFDGEPGTRLEIDPDPLKKSELRLPALRKTRSVEVRILEWRWRSVGRDAVGFSEIELVHGP